MIIYVDANIGTGKSTLLDTLSNAKFSIDHVVVQEPVEEWLDFRAPGSPVSLFELFYNDKTKYGFMFQMMALQSRISNLLKVQSENEGKLLICERSFMTDYEIFASEMHTEGHIDDLEMAIYMKWYNYIIEHVKPRIDGIIYLKATPDICFERINKRNRSGEKAIDIDYLQKMHDKHEVWLNARSDVFTVDANGDLDIDEIVKYIQGKINTLKV